jgi:hypothetical protein
VVTDDIDLVANFWALDFDTYSPTLWNNTFKLDIKKIKEEGYEITGCQWFKNGLEEFDTQTINEYSYSAGPNQGDLLDLAPTYYTFLIMTKNCGVLSSSKKMITTYSSAPTGIADEKHGSNEIIAYPNPVTFGTPLTLVGVTKGSRIQIYNRSGILVKSTIATDDTTTLTLHLPAEMYLLRVDNREIKIFVTK